MHIHAFGGDYFLDEKAFVDRITEDNKNVPPYRMEEIVAIQHQMKNLEDRILDHMRQTAMPDPMKQLRDHLDELIAREQ